MKILKSWLQRHIVETLPNDDIIEQAFILKSSEIEGVEKTKIDNKDDTIFDIKVLPDRAHYMLSHRGVAYDLCAVLGLTLKEEMISLPAKGSDIVVKIESDQCTRYSAIPIGNVSNNESPQWIKDSLQAIEARSINKIVDIANYAMFDTGQPLHVFDADKVVGKITVRLAKEGETIETLDGKNIVLRNNHLVIADDEGPLALAGIKGGKKAEVDNNTKNIILESACFDPVTTRKTSFEIGIRNDASKRYENEITPYLTEKGVSKFLQIIKMVSADCKIGKINDVYKELPKPRSIIVHHKNIQSILNISISEEKVIEILSKLECIVQVNDSNSKEKIYTVTPPFVRLDLNIEEDIVDEIGRINGLDKVKSVLPKAKNRHLFAREYLLVEKIKDFFVERGFDEIQTRTFVNKGDIEVAYPMALDKAYLRNNLCDGISNALDLAYNNAPLLGLEKIELFEIGKVFPSTGEELDLSFAIKYVKKQKNSETIVKNELEEVVKDLQQVLNSKLNYSITNNVANVRNLEKIQTEIKPDDIDNDSFSKAIFKPISPYPFIVRDVAVFVPHKVNENDVIQIIERVIDTKGARRLLANYYLFDVFKKEEKVSYAFRLIFQSIERTLTDEEVNDCMDSMYREMKSQGWEVR